MEVIDIDSESDQNEPIVDPIMIKGMYSVTIKESDYRRLDPEVYLNDNLIDFFLNYILHKKTKTFHIFNSFFFLLMWSKALKKFENGLPRLICLKKILGHSYCC
jgi:Protease, Ulp1 family